MPRKSHVTSKHPSGRQYSPRRESGFSVREHMPEHIRVGSRPDWDSTRRAPQEKPVEIPIDVSDDRDSRRGRAWRGLGATGLGLLLVLTGARYLADQPTAPNLPNITTPDGKKDLLKQVASGELIAVETDEDHKFVSSIAEALTPGDEDYRALEASITEELGGNIGDLPLGTTVFVPNTELAQELYAQQNPEQPDQAQQLPNNR